MAHNPRIRANLAAWGTGTITDVELDALDQAQFEAINGDDGGLWAPSVSQIEIAGLGLKVDTALDGDWTCAGNPTATTFNAGHFNATSEPGYRYTSVKTFAQQVPGVPFIPDSCWEVAAGGAFALQIGATASHFCQVAIKPLTGCTITYVGAYLKGGAFGTHIALPAYMPIVRLLSFNALGSALTPTNEIAIPDPSGTLSIYEATHLVSVACSVPVASTDSVYWLAVEGERGTNSVMSALQVRALYYQYTIDKVTNSG